MCLYSSYFLCRTLDRMLTLIYPTSLPVSSLYTGSCIILAYKYDGSDAISRTQSTAHIYTHRYTLEITHACTVCPGRFYKQTNLCKLRDDRKGNSIKKENQVCQLKNRHTLRSCGSSHKNKTQTALYIYIY